MVIFVKPSGATVVENDLISLGSHVGKIAIVSPNRVGAYVELLITPPSSEQIQPIYAAPMPSIDADDLGVYICDPASRIATASGRVRYQVRFTYSGGLVETTPEGTFAIQPGVVVIPPDDPPANIYEEIRAAILASSALYSEVIHELDKAMAAAELVEVSLADITAARKESVGAAAEARESAEKAENFAERSEDVVKELAAGRYIEKDPTVPAWAKQENPPIMPTEEIIDSTAVSVKDVPADVATYAEVVEIGGMTYKDGNILRHAAVTKVESVVGGKAIDTIHIPDAVRNLDGYGSGLDESVYNYVDFEKRQFVKRFPSVDMAALSWYFLSSVGCYASKSLQGKIKVDYRTPTMIAENYNAVGWDYQGNVNDLCIDAQGVIRVYTGSQSEKPTGILYYELAEPIITDISDLLADIVIRVKGGGTVRMVTEYGYDVPNTVRFFTSDNETIASESFVGDLHGTAARAKMAETDALGRVIHESYAPAGYGLGKTQSRGIPNNDVDDALENSWYVADASCKHNPFTGYGGNVFVYSSAFMIKQTWHQVSGARSVASRVKIGNTWSEWEYVNPPHAIWC